MQTQEEARSDKEVSAQKGLEAIAEQQAKMASAESSAAPASSSKKQQLSTKAESAVSAAVIDSSPTKSIDSFLPPSTATADNSIDNFLADSEETAAVTAAEAVTADSDDDEVSCNPMVMTRQQDFSSDEDVPTSAAVLRRSGLLFSNDVFVGLFI